MTSVLCLELRVRYGSSISFSAEYFDIASETRKLLNGF